MRSHTELLGLATINFFGYVAHEVYATVYVLYVIYMFGWNERIIGLSLALVGVASIVASGVLVGPVVARIGERRALLLGLSFATVGFFMFGWPAAWVFFAAIPGFVCGHSPDQPRNP